MRLKMLGLTVLATMGLLVTIGVGVAPATKLCTDSACKTVYEEGTTFHEVLVKGTTTKLTNGGSTIATCTESTIHQTLKKGFFGGRWVTDTKHWTNCNQTTDTVSNGSMEVTWTSGSNGTDTGQETQWTVQIAGVSCTYGYGSGTHLGTVTGGTEPIVKIATTISKTAGSFLCPNTVGWEAEYVIDEPHAVYIGS